MIYPIAVEGILRKVVTVEADSEEDAVYLAGQCYEKGVIVLDCSALITDPQTGSVVNIYPADWCDEEMAESLQHVNPQLDNENK
ncbi:MAG: hypothetical protein J1E98_00500 [Lachnospiraceae bacterium]|nr:hypothetical protein [Lachnospiraceae bacterium]